MTTPDRVHLDHAATTTVRPTALAALAEAAASAQSLYGRDPRLDAFLRKARKTQLSQLSGADLRANVETLQSLLAGLDIL